MQLKYFHVTFESNRKRVPADKFEAILHALNVVFGVYGQRQTEPDSPHILNCIIEDDVSMRMFNRLPPYIRAKSQIVREIKNISPFVYHLKLIMLDEIDLRVMDNTHMYID